MKTGWLKVNIRRKILENIKRKKHTTRSLCKTMKIKGGKAKALFFSTLKELMIEKKITIGEDGYYKIQKPKQKKQAQKKNIIHISKEGYGTVLIENDSTREKYIIYKENLNGALDGDTVEIESNDKQVSSGFKEAKIAKIIERANKAIFEYDGSKLVSHGIHGNLRVLCQKEELKELVSGSLVLVTLDTTAYMKKNENIIYKGKIERVVGHRDDPDAEIEIIGAKRGFFKNFREEALNQSRNIKDEITEEELKGRVDLRDEKVFTIDGSHTKDRDDAVSIDVDKDGYFILKVHIADVSHYVKENSPLDIEARERGTSLYMADSVIPMLPHELSNGICSLNENTDRLTKTVEMKIDGNGNIVSEKIYYSIINSKKAMTYEEVNEILENSKKPEGYEEFIEEIFLLYFLSQKQDVIRSERGNIGFNIPDTAIIEEDNQTVFEEIETKSAEKIIENCMILANTTIATHYIKKGLPMISRVHDEPNIDRLMMKLRYLMDRGLCGKDALYLIKKIENNKLTPYDLENFLNKYKNTVVEEIISTDILSCMSKAIYTDENRGHYGLALEHYTHFTSPIRRYPDLIVHRLIDLYESENTKSSQIKDVNEKLPDICFHSSFMERQADKAERESIELKMAEYSINHINEEYRGRVISFKPYGLDIKLDTNIRGVAKKSDIENFNNIKLGQTVYAIIKEVSVPHRAIYFKVVDKKKQSKTLKKI